MRWTSSKIWNINKTFSFLGLACCYIVRKLISNLPYLSSKETDVLPLYVLAKCHLQQLKPHVHGLHNVTLLCHGVLPSGTLPPRHLGLDRLEPLQHLQLQTLERGVEGRGANLVEPTGNLN